MKIIITEETYKKLIDEVMGVPNNITNSAYRLLDYTEKIIKNIKENELTKARYDFTFDLEFTIGDHTFTQLNLIIAIDKNPSVNGVEVETAQCQVTYSNMIKIIIIFDSAYSEPEKDDLFNAIEKNKKRLIEILSHELLHTYDNVKKPKQPTFDFVHYLTIQTMIRKFPIKPLARFSYNIYFTNKMEDVTRPSEFFGGMDYDKITKAQFLDYFNNNKIIKYLKNARNFSYEYLIGYLKNNIGEIDNFYAQKFWPNHQQIQRYMAMHPDDKIKMLLNEYILTLGNDIYDFMKDKRVPVDRYSQDYATKYFKNNNYERYFRDNIQKMNKVADKSLKKLSKLYDLAL